MSSLRTLLLGLGLLLATSATAAEPRLSLLDYRLEEDQVLLTFHLADAFDDALRERIASGLPTSLLFEMELQRFRRGWWDETLIHSELQVIAMYNAVTRDYLLNTKLDGKLIESQSIAGEEQLEKAMTTFTDLPFFQLAELAPGTVLQIRGRTDLGSRTRWFIPRRLRTPWLETASIRVPEPSRRAVEATP